MKRKYMRVCVGLLAMVLAVAFCIPTAGAAAGGGMPDKVYVGGMPFGVKFYTEGILVVGFCDVDSTDGTVNPARAAGMQLRDVIVGINGTAPSNASALSEAASSGAPVTLTVHRVTAEAVRRGSGKSTVKGGERTASPTRRESEIVLTITPVLSESEGRYKTGLYVRDSGAGIGTVTFIMPGTNAFAGLGHGICDGETGDLIPLGRGQVTDVTVSGVDRGEVGAPGAIKGYFAPGKIGSLLGNTTCGVWGVLATRPATAVTEMPVGDRYSVREGDASILCTLDDGRIGTYGVRITSIDTTATGSKCFTISVTDPALIRKTGGIVQGMSGSPVIQNGKLVGAVTHVLIHDPTTGYGIFIDNMLSAMPEVAK